MSTLAGWLLAGLLLALLGVASVRIYRGWSSRRWPRVQARVVTSWPELVPDGDSGDAPPRYLLRVTWSFRLGEGQYTGSGVSGPLGTAGPSRAAAAFRPGAALWVYHHPRRPSRSVLEPGVAESDMAVFLGAAVALGWVLHRLLA